MAASVTVRQRDDGLARLLVKAIVSFVSSSLAFAEKFQLHTIEETSFFNASLRLPNLGFFQAKRTLQSGPAGRAMKSAGLQIVKNETRFQFTLLPGTEKICAF